MLSLIIQLFVSMVQLACVSVVCMKPREHWALTQLLCFQKLSTSHTPACVKSYMKTSGGEQQLFLQEIPALPHITLIAGNDCNC